MIGQDLQVGNVLADWKTSRTITGFDPHPGLDGHSARIAKSGEWGITLFDDDPLGWTPYGWAPTHHVLYLRKEARMSVRLTKIIRDTEGNLVGQTDTYDDNFADDKASADAISLINNDDIVALVFCDERVAIDEAVKAIRAAQ